MLHDQTAREAYKNSPNTIVPWILMSSFLYYCRFDNILEDSTFDRMCRHLHKNYDQIEHRHKHLIRKDMLEAGSLFYLKEEDYPLITRVVAQQLLEEIR